MSRKLILSAIALIPFVLPNAGCTRVNVSKVCDAQTKGIRYYRPKPYLFITGAVQEQPSSPPAFTIEQQSPVEVKVKPASFGQINPPAPSGSTVTPGTPVGDQGLKTNQGSANSQPVKLSMKLEYLPDFAEEYAIDFRPGLGSGNLNVNLENGWNLTTIGVQTDQQTDDIIGSVGSLVGAIGGAFAKQGATGSSESRSPEIYGTNVPLGFYEAVIACDPRGRKQLYGWRYVGFMPFQSCPTQAGGMDSVCCNSDEVFGLVFVEGVLQFRSIGLIPRNGLQN